MLNGQLHNILLLKVCAALTERGASCLGQSGIGGVLGVNKGLFSTSRPKYKLFESVILPKKEKCALFCSNYRTIRSESALILNKVSDRSAEFVEAKMNSRFRSKFFE